MEALAQGLYDKVTANITARTYVCTSTDEISTAIAEKGDGFVKAMWCGSPECEDTVKAKTGVGSRCIPFGQEKLSDKCVCCGKPADTLLYWGKAY
jgi:prolyl-tRNA synthetase